MMHRQENMLVESHNMLRSMGIDVKDLKYQNNNLLDQNSELIEKVEDVQHEVRIVQSKLDISVEDRAPQPDKDPRKERLLLLKRDNNDYPYYIIRAQDVSAKRALKRQRDLYTGVVILLDLLCHPNTKTFYVRVKDDLKKRGVEFNFCEISIEHAEDITEEVLIKEIMKTNDEKRNVV
jgi:Fe-S cluster assembly scaffold protein SufB